MLFYSTGTSTKRKEGGKVFMAYTLMQKNNDLWTNEVTDGFPYKQTAIIFSTLWLWVPLPHLSMSMWSYLLDNIFVPFISLCGLKSEKTNHLALE